MPRSVTFIPSGLSTLGRLMTVTISSEAIGWSPSRAMPCMDFKSWKTSRVMALVSSAVDAFAHHQNLQRIAGGLERGPQPVHQRQHRQQHSHGESDAERGHEGGGLPDHQVAQIVRDRNRHGYVNRCIFKSLEDGGSGSAPGRDKRTQQTDRPDATPTHSRSNQRA